MPPFLVANPPEPQSYSVGTGLTSANLILAYPERLWESRGPEFKERPPDAAGAVAVSTGLKSAADALRSQARGFRPILKLNQFTDLEYQTTIMAGIIVLNSVGIYPWSTINTSAFPPLYFTKGKQRDNSLKILTELVVQAAAKNGDYIQPYAIVASEYVRKAVIDAYLQVPAWAMRGIMLTGEAIENLKLRGSVEGGVSSALSAASSVAAPIFPIGTIVAAILAPVATGLGVHAATVKVELGRAELQLPEFVAMYEQGMEARASYAQYRKAMEAAENVEAQAALIQKEAEATTEQTAKNIARAVEISTWLAVSGTGAMAAIWIYRRWQEKE